MSDKFKIYLSHLREGRREVFEGDFSPCLMDIDEKDLSFPWPITLSGEAYLAEGSLMVGFSAKVKARVRCAICNELTSIDLNVNKYLHEEKLGTIFSGVFDFRPVLRESILLELPLTAECNGNCPERESLQLFLKKD